MPKFPPLETLGQRIMICGPSNSGKSTLAVALGRKIGVPAVHLDQFRFIPGSDWVMGSNDEFLRQHDAAIAEDRWAMDGNYSIGVPQRLARATGLILLRENRVASLLRYFGRTWFQRDRAGALAGSRDSIKWNMIEWILFKSPANQRRYGTTLRATGLPLVVLSGMDEVKALYSAWGLGR